MTVAASFSATLVDEWVRAGLTDAVIAPGSRSTPLAVALARESRIALHVRLDERSAGLLRPRHRASPRLGRRSCSPRAERPPSRCMPPSWRRTSPGVPMIVCTADRPPELHHVGAPQTIEQVGSVRRGAALGGRSRRARRLHPLGVAITGESSRRRGHGWADGTRARCTPTWLFVSPSSRRPASCLRGGATVVLGTAWTRWARFSSRPVSTHS